MAKGKGSGNKTRPAYRDAGNGEFISEKTANRRNPRNWVKERLPLPGHGDTGGKKS